jgi:hypothetical protein
VFPVGRSESQALQWNWWNLKYFQWGLWFSEELNMVMADCKFFSFFDGKPYLKP